MSRTTKLGNCWIIESTYGLFLYLNTVGIIQNHNPCSNFPYRRYYRGAVGVFLVYDIARPNTFEHLELWLSEIRAHTQDQTEIMLIGNKCDLKHLRAVTFEEGKAFAGKKARE